MLGGEKKKRAVLAILPCSLGEGHNVPRIVGYISITNTNEYGLPTSFTENHIQTAQHLLFIHAKRLLTRGCQLLVSVPQTVSTVRPRTGRSAERWLICLSRESG